jgi:hypothetical protein
MFDSAAMRTFVVECYWPGTAGEQARDTRERVLRTALEARPTDGVRPLGCILVPADGMALFLFAAPNRGAVRRIGSLAEIPFDRIVESVHIGLLGFHT